MTVKADNKMIGTMIQNSATSTDRMIQEHHPIG